MNFVEIRSKLILLFAELRFHTQAVRGARKLPGIVRAFILLKKVLFHHAQTEVKMLLNGNFNFPINASLPVGRNEIDSTDKRQKRMKAQHKKSENHWL